MSNYFAFIDESGVLDESNTIQPYFAVGFLRTEDAGKIGEKLTQKHYDYFSMQKEKRKQMLCELNELNTLPNIFNTLRAHSETFTLLQMCDLMLGSVVFQWRQQNGFLKDSNRAKAKKDFVDHLISKLEISNNKRADYPLAQSITCNRPIYFSVWPLRLSQTKSGGV